MSLKISFIAVGLFFSQVLFGQSAQQIAVMMDAEVSTSPAAITLTWNNDAGATSYSLYRRTAASGPWGSVLTTTTDTFYTDQSVQPGLMYEYRVDKTGSNYNGFGYIQSGIDVKETITRGDALIIVEETVYNALPNHISSLVSDYNHDGFNAHLEVVSADTTVTYVKEIITNAFANMDSLTTVFIVGHVPVPYSGNIAPDGHANHEGAWPAEAYYADMDGIWTDQSVNNSVASDPRNHNVPGDGKFDQSLIPGNGRVEIGLGRIDFSNLTHFSQDEIALTRRYLERVHAYKLGQWTLPKRALIDDNFGYFPNPPSESFAGCAWMNFSSLVGKNEVYSLDYRTTLNNDGYLYSFGCGGGSHESAGGIGNSTQFSQDSLLTGFTNLFGSYFGDWDRQNNFMRSALAQGRTMTISWTGRPWWFYHPMGIGANTGMCMKASVGNVNTYHPGLTARWVHPALLGDPSLRADYVAPVMNLTADTIDSFHVQVSWSAGNSNPDGYHIFRSKNGEPFERLNATLNLDTFFVDSCVLGANEYVYQVKAMRLETTASGVYWNASLSQQVDLEIHSDKNPDISGVQVAQVEIAHPDVLFKAEGSWVTNYTWEVNGMSFSGDSIIKSGFELNLTNGETFNYLLEASNTCSSASTSGSEIWFIGGVDNVDGPDIQLYPNPNSNGVFYSKDLIDGADFFVFDVHGKRVQKGQAQGDQIVLPELSSGTYFIQIGESGDQFIQVQIISD